MRKKVEGAAGRALGAGWTPVAPRIWRGLLPAGSGGNAAGGVGDLPGAPSLAEFHRWAYLRACAVPRSIFFISAMRYGGWRLWMIAWQFGQTGRRSLIGSILDALPIDASGFK